MTPEALKKILLAGAIAVLCLAVAWLFAELTRTRRENLLIIGIAGFIAVAMLAAGLAVLYGWLRDRHRHR